MVMGMIYFMAAWRADPICHDPLRRVAAMTATMFTVDLFWVTTTRETIMWNWTLPRLLIHHIPATVFWVLTLTVDYSDLTPIPVLICANSLLMSHHLLCAANCLVVSLRLRTSQETKGWHYWRAFVHTFTLGWNSMAILNGLVWHLQNFKFELTSRQLTMIIMSSVGVYFFYSHFTSSLASARTAYAGLIGKRGRKETEQAGPRDSSKNAQRCAAGAKSPRVEKTKAAPELRDAGRKCLACRVCVEGLNCVTCCVPKWLFQYRHFVSLLLEVALGYRWH